MRGGLGGGGQGAAFLYALTIGMGLLGESARRRKHLRLSSALKLPVKGCEQPAFLSFQTQAD
jgi:hypothetical protein